MNLEKPLNSEHKKIDQEIFEEYQAVKLNILGMIAPSNTLEQENSFLEGKVENPTFSFDKINISKLDKKDNALIELKEKLKKQKLESGTPDLEQAYLWNINEKLAKIRMLKQLKLLESDPENQDLQNRYKRYNEFIYGKPDPVIFLDISNVIEDKLTKINLDELSEEQKKSYQNLLDFTQRTKENNKDIETTNIKENRPEYPKEQSEIVTDINEIKQAFEDALKEINLSNWKVVVADDTDARKNIGVIQSKKEIRLPNSGQIEKRAEDRKFTPETIKGLIAHEIKTHVLRNSEGEKSRFQLLSVGLDRYIEGEEGLATYREHQEKGAVDYSGLHNYLAAGLAYGLDGQGKRDFKGVFEIMKDYYSVIENEPTEKSKYLAWVRALRLFRGTPGTVPGLVFLKDIVYRRGNIATYELMKKDGSDKMDFDVGKYDPTNERHLQILIKLGILDRDLHRLER